MIPQTRKYQLRSTIAINGQQIDTIGTRWADSDKEARAKETKFRCQIVGCSTIQIWEAQVIGWHANEFVKK